ncbi:MAG: hypothetical protein R3F35_04020 [Myxococcota bacterium]
MIQEICIVSESFGPRISYQNAREIYDMLNHDQRRISREMIQSERLDAFADMMAEFMPAVDPAE